jgi:hypothetical protein
VEVAFLFPWATVFGKAANLMREGQRSAVVVRAEDQSLVFSPDARALYQELGVRSPSTPVAADARAASDQVAGGARQLLGTAMVAAGIFFIVLLIGFAYEWKTGALDWVRGTARARPETAEDSRWRGPPREQPVLST